jgi:hypothetical protein
MVLFKNVESKSSSSLNTIKIETKKRGSKLMKHPLYITFIPFEETLKGKGGVKIVGE